MRREARGARCGVWGVRRGVGCVSEHVFSSEHVFHPNKLKHFTAKKDSEVAKQLFLALSEHIQR